MGVSARRGGRRRAPSVATTGHAARHATTGEHHDHAPSTNPPRPPRAADPEAVAERLIGIFNDGGIAVLASIGHETRPLRDPGRAAAGHERADRRRRRARRALRARVARRRRDRGLRGLRARPAAPTRCAPTTRRSSPDAGPDNLARVMRYVTLMGQVAPTVVEKFRTGGGLSYDDYPGFHDLQADESAAVNDASLLDTIMPAHRPRRPAATPASTSPTSAAARATPSTCWPAPSRPAASSASTSARRRVAVGRAEAAAWGLTNATLRDRATSRRSTRRGGVRPGDRLRRDPRPGPPGDRARQHPPGAAARRDVPDGRHQRAEQPGGQPRAAVGLLPLRDLDRALHVGLARPGRRRARHRLGRADGGADGARGRLLRRWCVHDLEEDPFNAYFVARA